VALNMLAMDMGNHTVHAVSDGQGKYHADVQFTMPGQWQVTVTVQRLTSVSDYSSNVTVQ